MGFWKDSDQQQQCQDAYTSVTEVEYNDDNKVSRILFALLAPVTFQPINRRVRLQAKFSHELIAAGAAYEASKAYENHEAQSEQYAARS